MKMWNNGLSTPYRVFPTGGFSPPDKKIQPQQNFRFLPQEEFINWFVSFYFEWFIANFNKPLSGLDGQVEFMKHPPKAIYKNRSSENFLKINRKTHVSESVFNKEIGLRSFPVHFAIFFRTPFLQNTFRWLPLEFSESTFYLYQFLWSSRCRIRTFSE